MIPEQKIQLLNHTMYSRPLALLPANITLPVVACAIWVMVVGTGKLHSRIHCIRCIWYYVSLRTKSGNAVPLLSIHVACAITEEHAVHKEN